MAILSIVYFTVYKFQGLSEQMGTIFTRLEGGGGNEADIVNKTRPLFTLSLEMTRLVNETRLLLVPGVNSDIYSMLTCCAAGLCVCMQFYFNKYNAYTNSEVIVTQLRTQSVATLKEKQTQIIPIPPQPESKHQLIEHLLNT